MDERIERVWRRQLADGFPDLRGAQAMKGRLLLYYGTADNNVHPSNSLQLVDALRRAGKSFDLQVGPDEGHGAVNVDRMMEFFIENLIGKGALAASTY